MSLTDSPGLSGRPGKRQRDEKTSIQVEDPGQTMGGTVGPVDGGLLGSGSRVGAGWFVG